MTIRKARWADLHRVFEIERAAFGRESYGRTTFVAHVLRDWKGFFVSEAEEGEVTGYALVRVAFGLLTGRRGGVTSVAVAKQHQRSGVGRQLLLHALEYLRGRGVEEVDLEVSLSNRPALSLYESLGFARDRTLPHYYGPDKHGVRMVRDLRETRASLDPAAPEAGRCESEAEGHLSGKAGRARDG